MVNAIYARCIAALVLAYASKYIKGQSIKPEFDLWSHINVEHLEYAPKLAKHSNPPDVAGKGWKVAAHHADGNLAAYFYATSGQPSGGQVAPPFRPQHYTALVNVERRLIYFKPTLTAGTSLWRAWIAPKLCPPRSPGASATLEHHKRTTHCSDDVEVIQTETGPITIAKDPTCRAGAPLHECVSSGGGDDNDLG